MDTQSKTSNKPWIYVLITICVIGLGLAVPSFLDVVRALGHNIPQEDVTTDYFIGLVWAITLGVSILAWPVPSKDKIGLLVVWLVKSLVTLGFMLLYENNYGLDAYGYFDVPRQSDFVWEGLNVGAGTQNISILAWLHHQVLPASYHAMKVSFAMVGLVAIYIFYRAAVIFMKRENKRVFYILALFPSILFWASILGKEPIILLGISLYVYGVVGWSRLKRLRYLLVIALGIIVVALIRTWLVPILLAPLVIFVLDGMQGKVSKVTLIAIVFVAFLLSFSLFMNMFGLKTTEDLVATTNRLSRGWAIGGSAQEVPEFTSIGSMVAFVPLGAFTALFRPLPGDLINPFGILASLENLVLLVMLLLAVKRMRWSDLKEPIVLWAILLVIIWAIVYGFISYQNLGTAVRYRLQILPVLLGILLYLGRRHTRVISAI
ncbi:MAG: hypothetical protein L6282_00710 [Candidatus Methanoperedenaceae archaeon]|nr:hypothetical protein [Candidatus Methanoperedenaceae archaeon]